MIKFVIFDMDGVLVDSERIYIKHVKNFIISKGYSITCNKLMSIVGSTLQKTYEIIADAINEKDLYKTIFEYEEYLSNHKIDYKKIVNEGVYDLLTYLKTNNIKMALASSASVENIYEVVDSIGVREYFEIMVSGDQFKESKPNPEIYIYTMNKCGFSQLETLIVEDSYYGILAGKKAKVQVIALNQKHIKQDVSMADYQVESLLDVIDFIENGVTQ